MLAFSKRNGTGVALSVAMLTALLKDRGLNLLGFGAEARGQGSSSQALRPNADGSQDSQSALQLQCSPPSYVTHSFVSHQFPVEF